MCVCGKRVCVCMYRQLPSGMRDIQKRFCRHEQTRPKYHLESLKVYFQNFNKFLLQSKMIETQFCIYENKSNNQCEKPNQLFSYWSLYIATYLSQRNRKSYINNIVINRLLFRSISISLALTTPQPPFIS